MSSAVSHYSFVINVGIQNILQGSQGTPTQSAVRSVVMVMLKQKQTCDQRKMATRGEERDSRSTRRAAYLSDRGRGRANSQDARPRSTACRNASPADCGAESFPNVPAFIAANTFAGFVSFCAGPPGSGGAPPPKPLPLP